MTPRLVQQLTEFLQRHPNRLDLQRSLFRQFDSLQLVDLVINLEKEFSVRIASFEVTPENFANVLDLARFLERKRGA